MTTSTTPTHQSADQAPTGSPDREEDSAETIPEVAGFHERVESAVASADMGFRDLRDQVIAIIARGAIEHRNLINELSLDGEPAEVWRVMRVVSNGFRDRVTAPARSGLEDLRIVTALHDVVRSAVASLEQAVADLPSTIRMPDVTAIYKVASGDSLQRRSRKAFERAKRRVRRVVLGVRRVLTKVFHRSGSVVWDERIVDLRALADFHVQMRVVPLLVDQHRKLQQGVSNALAVFEEAAARCVLDVVDMEYRLDRAVYHRPAVAVVPDVQTDEEVDDPEDDQVTPELPPAASALSDTLQAAGDELSGLSVAVTEHAGTLREAFDRDVQYGGTFLVKRRDRVVPRGRRRPIGGSVRVAREWRGWCAAVINRLEVVVRLSKLRDDLVLTEEGLLDRLASATIRPVADAFERIKRLLAEAIRETDRACDAVTSGDHFSVLVDALQRVQENALNSLRRTLRNVPGAVSAHDALSTPGQPEWDDMLQLIAELPGDLPVHRLQTEGSADHNVSVFTIDLQAIARDALDPPLPAQLEKGARPLSQRIIHVWDDTSRVEDIIKFNLEATVEELVNRDDSVKDDVAGSVSHARELATGALRRSCDTLDDILESLGEPWLTLEHAVFETFQEDWNDVRRRVATERAVEERWFGFRTRLSRVFERRSAAVRASVSRWAGWIQGRGKTIGRNVRRLIARGQAAVGVAEAREDESIDTLDSLTDLPRMQSELPLVYRKLFSFEPLTEPTLLEGRSRDLVRVRRQYERWLGRHDRGVVVVSSPLGGGRTSFLNAVTEKVLAEADVVRVSLDERVRTRQELASLFAAALGESVSASDGLDNLQEILLSQGRSEVPKVCLVDNIEHLVTQSVRGTDLIEDVLVFLSRTDAVMYWLVAVAREAWHFVEKTASGAAGFVTHFPLTPFDREVVEDVVMGRHRRSGIPVEFRVPKTPSPLLRQRLRRARTQQRKQAILSKEYFDGLYAATQQNIKLALFYWIRDARFEGQQDEVSVNPFDSLSFRFLESLDATRSFTLKAFMVHNTMTLEDHASIFRMSVDESGFILESLLNQRLIEPVRPRRHDDDENTAGVEPGQPYRIPRLILEPVLRHLRNKHFVY